MQSFSPSFPPVCLTLRRTNSMFNRQKVQTMRKLFLFFALFAAVIGAVGGISLAVVSGEYPLAVCIAVLSFLASFKAREWWTDLAD